MLKSITKVFAVILIALMMVSCYSYKFSVGKGAQGNLEVTAWNHYVVYGLAPVAISDPAELAEGAENYDIIIEHTFVNGLIASLTFGIYTPTTTKIIK